MVISLSLLFFLLSVCWLSFATPETSKNLQTVYEDSIFDPHVFNPYFYANTNSLSLLGLYSIEDIKTHWNQTGVKNGLQACGSFHSKQYLDRYPDLKKKFDKNYYAAIQHYLTKGLAKGYFGYFEGGDYGRYTISQMKPEGIFVSASDRMAYAIDSVVWNSNEFINAWDHGRELQIAITTGTGECYNPTEAGNLDDDVGQKSTSLTQDINVKGAILESTVFPAFWLEPGEKEPNPSDVCKFAFNTVKVSNYSTSKTVIVGPNNVSQAIQFSFTVIIPEDLDQVIIEAPTGYMNIIYDSFYTYNLTSKVLTPVDRQFNLTTIPHIFATEDGKYAMGAFIKNYPHTETPILYGRFYFNFSPMDMNSTTKWTMIWQSGRKVTANTQLNFNSYICVGTLQDVTQCMSKLNSE
jgi:hypothetical protein